MRPLMDNIIDKENPIITLIEQRAALSRQTTTVPINSFSPETARALADKLNMFVHVRSQSYVFTRKRGIGPYLMREIEKNRIG